MTLLISALGVALIAHSLYTWSPAIAEAFVGACALLWGMALAGRRRTIQPKVDSDSMTSIVAVFTDEACSCGTRYMGRVDGKCLKCGKQRTGVLRGVEERVKTPRRTVRADVQ